ncbi:DNA breaking-rejoining protein, partial [Escherichia coli]|nr:DNA breaking-rejoining protein [Escherichia coli]
MAGIHSTLKKETAMSIIECEIELDVINDS